MTAQIDMSSMTKNKMHIKRMIDDRCLTPILTYSSLSILPDDPPSLLIGKRLNMGVTLVEMTNLIWKKVQSFRYPMIVIHGKKDTLCLPGPAERFYQKAASQDKTMEMYVEGRHEMQWDKERERVVLVFRHFNQKELSIWAGEENDSDVDAQKSPELKGTWNRRELEAQKDPPIHLLFKEIPVPRDRHSCCSLRFEEETLKKEISHNGVLTIQRFHLHGQFKEKSLGTLYQQN